MTGRSLRIVAPGALAVGAVLVFAIGGSSAKTARTAQAAKTYNFRLSEFNIGGPTRLQAGQATLKFWDAGRFQHNFTVVAGPDRFGTKTSSPNETGSISRNLKLHRRHAGPGNRGVARLAGRFFRVLHRLLTSS